MSKIIENRYEFAIIFDVENGNPNGDPDAGNMPRVDPETNLGIVTDVCLKKKIRNYVEIAKENEPGYDIYIKQGVALNTKDKAAYVHTGIEVDGKGKLLTKIKDKAEKDLAIRDYMCGRFFDIRTFGAVMTTFVKASFNSGQVRGPVQLGFAKSIDPIFPQDITITRCALATEEEAEKQNNTMGKKYIVPYGLYMVEGYVSANLARKNTSFSEADLQLLWEAIVNMPSVLVGIYPSCALWITEI